MAGWANVLDRGSGLRRLRGNGEKNTVVKSGVRVRRHRRLPELNVPPQEDHDAFDNGRRPARMRQLHPLQVACESFAAKTGGIVRWNVEELDLDEHVALQVLRETVPKRHTRRQVRRNSKQLQAPAF